MIWTHNGPFHLHAEVRGDCFPFLGLPRSVHDFFNRKFHIWILTVAFKNQVRLRVVLHKAAIGANWPQVP